MIKVGLTGNIGSGKSTMSHIFESLGIPVFYADTEAKKLYSNSLIKQKVISAFGKIVLNENKEVNFKALAEIVFMDKSKLNILTKILHPAVFNKYDQWLVKNKTAPFTIHESAIIFEYSQESNFHKIICVSAPFDLRLNRVCERDDADAEMVKSRMNNQLDEKLKIAKSDFIISNDEKSFLIPQVLEVFKQISSK